jgi:hypothetical protein
MTLDDYVQGFCIGELEVFAIQKYVRKN